MARLCRFGPAGAEKAGLIDSHGRIRDASAVCDAAGPEWVSEATVRMLGQLDLQALPSVAPDVRLGACIAKPGKFIGIGLNYRDHIAEIGMSAPEEPAVFLKAPSCICGPDDDVRLARGSGALDWEVELGVVIGRRATCIDESDAVACIAGYCTVIDFSDRHFQLQRGGQWTKGKSADTYGPVGPWLMTASEMGDPQALRLWLSVDGELRQSGSTRDMLWGVASLVSYVSKFMTLEAGDLIATGTPAGVALAGKPPSYLVAGSIVRCGVEGLGEQCHRIVRGS